MRNFWRTLAEGEHGLTAEQAFLSPAPGAEQLLVLDVGAGSFPPWARGKHISLTGLTLLAFGWSSATFVVEPQASLGQMPAEVTLTQVPGTQGPAAFSAELVVPPGTERGATRSFKLRSTAATDFESLRADQLGDLLLLIAFTVS